MSSGSDDEEDYAFYGTPLDPIEEDDVPSKRPVPIEEQIVRDKQGRRRFHGAFTGGFSAGYCNSVGSEEGWTPSSFKSSRSEKASSQAQKAEDFMDEEDKSEFGFAPKVLRATADYRQQSSRKRSHMQLPSGPIPGRPVLKDLLQPVKDTVGVRLLRNMGWRPGQGVGPRLNQVQKTRQKKEIQAASKRIYGCTPSTENQSFHGGVGSGESSDDSQDGDHESVLFAPHDYEAFLVKPKDDVFGIGYKGLDKKPVLSGHIQLFQPSFLGLEEKKKKVAIWGQAFGVGALEEDDEDIYARDDMSQYDFALDTSATIAQRKREEQEAEHRKTLANSNPDAAHLDSFVLGKKKSTSQKFFFKPPVLPANFIPVHAIPKIADAPPHLETSHDVETSKKRGLLRHELRASGRACMLDEPLPVPPLFFPDIPSVESEVPKSNEGIALGSTFRPFASQPDKQIRYEKFLSFVQKGQKDLLPSIQPPSMTDWDKEHERSEFEQAARLYKPLSGVMSDRFVTATQSDDSLNPLVPVERMKHGNADMQNAAKAKMFGKLTRTMTQWQPSALLCKRFNVPPPFGVTDVPKVGRRQSRFSVFDFLDASKENSEKCTEDNSVEVTSPAEPHPSSSKPISTIKYDQNPSALDSEVSGPPADLQPSPSKPTMITKYDQVPSSSDGKISGSSSTLARLLADDTGKEHLGPEEKPDLFKAIFLSSSEESGSDEEDMQELETPADSGAVKQFPALRNMSPPRGIFANLDLDSMNMTISSKEDKESVPSDCTEKNESGKKVSFGTSEDKDEDLVYGPRLPSSVSTRTQSAVVTPQSSSLSAKDEYRGGVWVERVGKKDVKVKYQSSESSSDESDGEDSSHSRRRNSKKKSSTSTSGLERPKKEKHRKHSKHKKEKKHKKHKSKSKHQKRNKD